MHQRVWSWRRLRFRCQACGLDWPRRRARCLDAPPHVPEQRYGNESAWNAPTARFTTLKLTPGQQWRANGGRW
jgi:hypothetical protein